MSGVILVTGAGRGIGAAIARQAAKRGYKVAVNYARSADGAKSVAAEIERGGGKAIAVRADVSIEADIVEMFRTVDRDLGKVTALVNNAGIMTTTPAASLTAEAVNGMLHTNVTGLFLCIREAVRRMSPEFGGKGGSIVNLGSMAAKLGGLPGYAAYAASKGAVDSLTVGLARELGKTGIRVNAVRPGLTRTDMIDQAGGTAAVEQMAKAAVPMGRLGEPDEIANVILWLLSDEASYVTGALYDVSGGR
jgi:NAD(P)-dependent dehydrogenase (short-subunit alcohol dehydrogenase family)